MKYYIAMGEICELIEGKRFSEAGEILNKGLGGTIIAFNPLEDNFEELISETSGLTTKILTSEELNEIQKRVQMYRPIYKIGDERIPYERMTSFFTEASIKELTSKEILK